ncbi:MAG: 5-(carboxyamino)imidazole ribonucleotide synthase [Verrucomicrobiota bacterium]|nr:5-(carboxyamino)imidazole ribonucleotide synthase [Verrucomicrobiota bacterium]
MTRRFLPGATVGVMGGGQLGRMFAIAARTMGYRVHIFSPEANGPAAQMADYSTVAEYADENAVRTFASQIDVLTFEFENIPAATAEWCAEQVPVRPSGFVLHTAQDRLREKDFLSAAGIPVAPYRAVRDLASLAVGLGELGTPAILKSAAFGYDGKGQQRITGEMRPESIWQDRPGDEMILERAIEFELELSVIIGRTADGQMATFPVAENVHRNHILDLTVAPARIDRSSAANAEQVARGIAEHLELVGLLAVEMFLRPGGELLVNEIAPRPHNSGHWTIEGCATSQFEQQLRAVCGLRLGSTELLRPAAMANLLGDLWIGGEPNWIAAFERSPAHLHLYGKTVARDGRKMGHLTVLAADAEQAIDQVTRARAALVRR